MINKNKQNPFNNKLLNYYKIIKIAVHTNIIYKYEY